MLGLFADYHLQRVCVFFFIDDRVSYRGQVGGKRRMKYKKLETLRASLKCLS